MRDSNPRHPACKADATTAELIGYKLERATGIEPVTQPWQGHMLPLAPCPHTLIYLVHLGRIELPFPAYETSGMTITPLDALMVLPL